MPYAKNNYKDHDINYLNKDFTSLKNRLIQYKIVKLHTYLVKNN